MYETLAVDREGHLTWLTLNRPDALNAMSRDAGARAAASSSGSCRTTRETRVLVLRGAGRAFCAGLDLKERPSDGGGVTGSVAAGLRAQRTISELVHADAPRAAADHRRRPRRRVRRRLRAGARRRRAHRRRVGAHERGLHPPRAVAPATSA